MASKIENTLSSALNSLSAFGSLSDTVEMVKKTWGQMGMPSSLAPTMDIEELDKRIADLQAVEQWLIANQTMLRGTIQGLEVQRNTIATVQALGKQVNQQFGVDFGAMTAGLGSKKSEAGKVGEKASGSKKAVSKEKANANSLDAAAQALNMPGLSTSAWWDLLQSQFNQIAQAAIATSSNAATSGAKSFGAAATSAATKAAKRVAKEVATDMMKDAAKSVGKTIVKKLTPKTSATKRKSK
jgi:hypothetical protein